MAARYPRRQVCFTCKTRFNQRLRTARVMDTDDFATGECIPVCMQCSISFSEAKRNGQTVWCHKSTLRTRPRMLGLFNMSKTIRRGAIITRFGGRQVRLKPAEAHGSHLIELRSKKDAEGKRLYLDCSVSRTGIGEGGRGLKNAGYPEHDHLGAFANWCEQPNSSLSVSADKSGASLVARRDILPHEEIFAAYGRHYNIEEKAQRVVHATRAVDLPLSARSTRSSKRKAD